MTILLALCVPLSFVAGGFVAYKGVHLGLRWQIQTNKQEQPTFEIKNPIAPIIEKKQAQQQKETVASLLDEWVNGGGE